MTLRTPIDIGPWDIATRAHLDSGSVVSSSQVLQSPDRQGTVYEIASLRATMSEDGTGDLSSMGFADGPIPVAASLANNDETLMLTRSDSRTNTFAMPNVYWHWGRSNQIALTQPTIYMPPEFYWGGELHGVFQNGAGATVAYLYTVIFRMVRFPDKDWADILAHILPGSAKKKFTDTT